MNKVTMLAIVLAAVGRNHANLERPASEADLLRAYAFGKCLGKAYDQTKFGEDAERAADGYLQMGRVNRPAVYDEIAKFAESLSPAKPTVGSERNLAIMSCLEFYESSDLKRLVARKTMGLKN